MQFEQLTTGLYTPEQALAIKNRTLNPQSIPPQFVIVRTAKMSQSCLRSPPAELQSRSILGVDEGSSQREFSRTAFDSREVR